MPTSDDHLAELVEAALDAGDDANYEQPPKQYVDLADEAFEAAGMSDVSWGAVVMLAFEIKEADEAAS
jgi:hypothetical protein